MRIKKKVWPNERGMNDKKTVRPYSLTHALPQKIK